MTTGSALRQDDYAWDDYRQWSDDRRWEILDGEAFAMTPAPSMRHQDVVAQLHVQLEAHFAGKTCRVVLSPADVKLSEHDVVQPDLAVVCDPKQIKPSHVEGAPTLIIEVLSPSTEVFDRRRKMALYARSGVKEVWLVRPYPSLIEVYVLDGSSYRLVHALDKTDKIQSHSFPELSLDLERIFDFPLEAGEAVAMVKAGHPPYATR
jgi:Uma2 family endonuclease